MSDDPMSADQRPAETGTVGRHDASQESTETTERLAAVPWLQTETVARLQALSPSAFGVAAVCPLVLFVVSGLGGGVIGMVGVSLWLFAPVNAFVVAQLGVLLLLPGWPGLLTGVGVEAGLAMLLFAEVVHEHGYRWTLGVFVVLALLMGGGTLAALRSDATLWQVALGLAVTTALASYGLHRYELLQLGLLAETDT
ncbi:hypothetical protein [Halorientalis marina]|uniref:hypothetical protein n=1 Tax=Halorientalis marina TaxID=2931976 RepID=UPI001FF205BF|nr:hypothetical protein [Halorientalis marina]